MNLISSNPWHFFLIPFITCFVFSQPVQVIKEPAASQSQNSGESGRDFHFSNMDIRSAFRAISAAGQVDVVTSPEVKGKITMDLTDKTWKEAMDVICQVFNLQYHLEKEYIFVQTLQEYNESANLAELEREIIKINHAKVTDLSTAINSLTSPRGKITIVERTNAIIVQDIREKIEEIKSTIIALDIENLQVHIQAQIIEVNSDAAQEMGINWSAGSGGYATDPGTGIGVAGAKLDQIPNANQSSALVSSAPGRVSPATMSLAFGLLNGNLGATLEYLLTESHGEVVAKPQITTLDNMEASIFIGSKIPFNKLDQNYNSSIEFVDGGIELIVTPHITNDNRIILDLAPKRSSATIDAITRGPVVTTQEAKTTVVVNDGQTVVIGGLTSKSENKIEKGVPILKDIPLLGVLFRYTKTQVIKEDLIIFITPHIIRSNPTQRNRLAAEVNAQQEGAPAATQKLEDEKVIDFLDELGGD